MFDWLIEIQTVMGPYAEELQPKIPELKKMKSCFQETMLKDIVMLKSSLAPEISFSLASFKLLHVRACSMTPLKMT
eukprot:764504-Hanusia_phi.AAC.3